MTSVSAIVMMRNCRSMTREQQTDTFMLSTKWPVQFFSSAWILRGPALPCTLQSVLDDVQTALYTGPEYIKYFNDKTIRTTVSLGCEIPCQPVC